MISRRALLAAPLLLQAADKPPTESVKSETVEGFKKYVAQREHAIQRERTQGRHFLWADEAPGRRDQIQAGEILVVPVVGKGTAEVKGGLVHDWLGAAFLPRTTLSEVLGLVQNYDNHRNIYQPEVTASKVLERHGDRFRIHLRLLKKKIITVVLNTEHEVRYFSLDSHRVHSRSATTRIAEVDDPGTPQERELPPGEDHGFLWRLNTYWRFLQRDGGVWIECEAISLTRGIPFALGWLISPIVRELPRESLESTLEATRRALAR